MLVVLVKLCNRYVKRACGNLYLHLDFLSLRGFKPYNYPPRFAPCLLSSAIINSTQSSTLNSNLLRTPILSRWWVCVSRRQTSPVIWVYHQWFYYGLISASLAYSENNETDKSCCSDFSPTTCLRVTQGGGGVGSLLKAGLARAKHYTPLRLGSERPIVLLARQKIGRL